MKRFILILLAVLLIVLPMLAVAEAMEFVPAETTEETGTEADGAAAGEQFLFRGGITWGMSIDEVRTIEGSEAYRREYDDSTGLIYGYTDVSIYTADYLVYVFTEDGLQMVTYAITNNAGESVYDYFVGALTTLYGEATDITADDAIKAMGWYDSFDGSQITKACVWNAKSANIITALDSEVDITYINPDFSMEVTYNTNGL